MQARFLHGDPIMVDVTAATPVSAGDVIPVSAGVKIAHLPIATGVFGAAAIGGGVYEVTKVSGVNTALPDGVKVYWDQTVSGAVSLPTGNKGIGLAVSGVGVSDVLVKVVHVTVSP